MLEGVLGCVYTVDYYTGLCDSKIGSKEVLKGVLCIQWTTGLGSFLC